MKNSDAKFILAAYRPGGRDATDPFFAEPLAQARRDPELNAWLKAQVSFDAFVSDKLREVQPPPGLRDTILAGARLSRPNHRSWWRRPHWFAAAAAILLLAFALVALRRSPASPRLADLTRFALRDTASYGGEHFGSVAAMRELEERLASTQLNSDATLNLDFARLRASGCRTVRVAGREVFEICFGRNHEFHLYVAQPADFAAPHPAEPEFTTEGRLSAATWANSRSAFSLVTMAGASALRQRL